MPRRALRLGLALALLAVASGPVGAQETGENAVPPRINEPARGGRLTPTFGVGLLDGGTVGAIGAALQWSWVTDRLELPVVRAGAFFAEKGVFGAGELRVHLRALDIFYVGGGGAITGKIGEDFGDIVPLGALGILDRGSGFRMELRVMGIDDPWYIFSWGGFWF